jgi:hypothetical protein
LFIQEQVSHWGVNKKYLMVKLTSIIFLPAFYFFL